MVEKTHLLLQRDPSYPLQRATSLFDCRTPRVCSSECHRSLPHREVHQ